jgi:gamma-glutamyltranspeptidase/glutathione hydrolase
MVASSQPLATQAGLELLAKGGSAADAAVGVGAVLAVTEPMSTGVGGDAFALYYDASTQRITAVNGSGRAPGALSVEVVQRQGLSEGLPPHHPHAVTVPGATACWSDLVAVHGRLPMGEILGPAVQLAERGFPVAPLTAQAWDSAAERLTASGPAGAELLMDGRAPRPGEIFRNPGLARALRLLGDQGAKAFYQGEIAEAIVAALHQKGGLMSMGDLAAHESEWVEPISTTYRGLRVWECPPNGQGIVALLALNLLEGFDLASMAPLGAKRLHLIIEALRLAFADAFWYVADPHFGELPLDSLLSKEYAEDRRGRIDEARRMDPPERGSRMPTGDTVYLSVVDGEGNACSFINSLYQSFGAGIVPRGWGFCLQNRGLNFRLDPEHPNALAPGKRPYHTIIPAMATHQDGSLYATFGVMGGLMQAQGHTQVVLGLWDDGLDPQAALDRPRIRLLGDYDLTSGGVAMEEGIPLQSMGGLVRRGHKLHSVSGFERAMFGRGQVILRQPDNGILVAGSDPRADGCALGLR